MDDEDRMSFSSMTVRDEELNTSGIWNESDVAGNLSSDDDSIATFAVDDPDQFRSPAPSLAATSGSFSSFAIPTAPPTLRKCDVCKRTLKTEKGFQNHMLNHRWQKAAERSVAHQTVMRHLRSGGEEILQKIVFKTENSASAKVGLSLMNKVDTKEWEDFCDTAFQVVKSVINEKSKVVMPSVIQGRLLESLSKFYANKDFLNECFDKFKVLLPGQESVFWLFLFDFLETVNETAVIFLCKSMRGGVSAAALPRKSDANHRLTHQVTHYIAGAALRHFIRKARQYPKSVKLQTIKDCILTKFATAGAPAIVDSKDKGYWTQLLNRKSLLFVNDNAFVFFNHLNALLIKCESWDGSVLHNTVMDKLLEERTMLTLWDGIVEGSLPESVSFDLFCKVVRMTTNTYGKGIMLRRMNALSKSKHNSKSTLQVSHRGRLI